MQEKLKRNLYYLSIVAIAILAIILFRLIKIYDICCTLLGLFLPILFGYIFAWILNPIHKKLSRKFGKRISIGILIAITIAFYGLIIWYLLPIFTSNIENLFELVNSYIEKFSELPFLDGLKKYSRIEIDVLIASCSNILAFLGTFGLMHIFGFYILWSYDRVNALLRSFIPENHRRLALEYIRKMSREMRLYIKGTLLDTLILFVISVVLYAAIGLKYPALLALFSATTNIIPFIGPYIGGIPAVLVGLSSSFNLGILALGIVVFAQTVESNFINPFIMSKCIKVNPLLIIISLTVMGKLAGLLGMIFAVPVIIILKLVIEFIKKYKKPIEAN